MFAQRPRRGGGRTPSTGSSDRAGNRVPSLAPAALGDNVQVAREELPPYRALFRRGQLRWTAIGISSYVFCGTAFFLISVLLPKALVDQGAAVTLSFGVSTLVFTASIPGKGFTGFLMEIIGRRWTIFYALFGSLPGLFLMMMAHRGGPYATAMMVTGAVMTGFTDALGRDRLPDLPRRTVPDGAARARTCLWRVDRAGLLRCAGSLPDGTAYRLADDIFRHDIGGRDDRRLHPAVCSAARPSASSKPSPRGPRRRLTDRARSSALIAGCFKRTIRGSSALPLISLICRKLTASDLACPAAILEFPQSGRANNSPPAAGKSL